MRLRETRAEIATEPPALPPGRPAGQGLRGGRYLEAQARRLPRRQAAVQLPCKAERGRASGGAAAPRPPAPTGTHPPSRRPPALPAQVADVTEATCAGAALRLPGLAARGRRRVPPSSPGAGPGAAR